MYGKRQLMVLGPALLAALTLGPASISHASATPDPTPPAASAQQSKPTTDLAPPARDPRGGTGTATETATEPPDRTVLGRGPKRASCPASH